MNRPTRRRIHVAVAAIACSLALLPMSSSAATLTRAAPPAGIVEQGASATASVQDEIPEPGPGPVRATGPVEGGAVYPTPGPGPTTVHPPTPPLDAITILSVGDSITWGADGTTTASYRGEFSRLLNLNGQPHAWVVAAIPGTKCSYWAENIEAAILANDPDLILLYCGTNDTPSDDTEQDYDTILDIAAQHGVQVVAALIGVPDMRNPVNSVRDWIDDWMHGTNVAIAASLAKHPSVAVADMQRIPANLEFKPDGIHCSTGEPNPAAPIADPRNARCDAAMGQLFYQATQPILGWAPLDQFGGEMCGLSGNWPAEPEPIPNVDYKVCSR